MAAVALPELQRTHKMVPEFPNRQLVRPAREMRKLREAHFGALYLRRDAWGAALPFSVSAMDGVWSVSAGSVLRVDAWNGVFRESLDAASGMACRRRTHVRRFH